MTELKSVGLASDFDRATRLTPVPARDGDFTVHLGMFSIETSTGGLAVEHGVITTQDGTLVADSFRTRLTATG
jgi:hypothetical protein